MLKRLFVICQYAILNSIPYAIGYGVGEYVGELLQFPEAATILLACGLLLVAGALGNKLIHAYEKKYSALDFRLFCCACGLYILMDFCTDRLFQKSFGLELLDNLSYELVIGLIAFVVSRLLILYKTWRIRRKYGTGEQGYRLLFMNKEMETEAWHRLPGRAGRLTRYLSRMKLKRKESAVRCSTGTYVGGRHRGVYAFKGIRYALPPVGTLRWKAPQPLPYSTDIHRADHFSPVCPQPDTFMKELNHAPKSEDCLTLNIWTAKPEATAGLPVLVFIHGGDLTFGGSSFPLYDGHFFVKQNRDAVVVTLNYRLGIFGVMDFADVPGGESYPDSTDLPLLDQIAALKWVKENIAGFGGDPENVTVCGCDAGATCVAILAVLPQARGLFRRAILLSMSIEVFLPRTYCINRTVELMKYLHVHSVTELAALPTETLDGAQKALGFMFTSLIPGKGLVPANLAEDYRNGAAAGIDLLCCSCESCTSQYVTYLGLPYAEKFFRQIALQMKSLLPAEQFRLYEEYTATAKAEGRSLPESYFFDYLFQHSVLMQLCHGHAARQQSARYFRWRISSPIDNFGAFSGIELPFLFNTIGTVEKYAVVGDMCMGHIMQRALVQFMKNGNPDLPMDTVCHNAALHWPVITEKSTPVLVVNPNDFVIDDEEMAKRMRPVERILQEKPELLLNLIVWASAAYKKIEKGIGQPGQKP